MNNILKVLIVEDNPSFRRLLCSSLQTRFPCLQIIEAEDGPTMFKQIEDRPPDLIFMDIKLQGANGLELTQKIKKNHAAIPIIILTSYNLPEYRQAAAQAGADYFIPKDAFLGEENTAFLESLLK